MASRRFLRFCFLLLVFPIQAGGCASSRGSSGGGEAGGGVAGEQSPGEGGGSNGGSSAGGEAAIPGTGGSSAAGGNANGGTSGAAGAGGAAGNAVGGASGGAGAGGGAPVGNPYVYVSGYDPVITILRLDMATGTLSPVSTVQSGIAAPSYLAFSPDRKFLYAVGEVGAGDSKVTAFRINTANGGLTKINEAGTGGAGSPHLSVHPSGKLVLVAHYGSGHVSTLKVDALGGVVTPPADVERPANNTSHHITADRSGNNVFVANVNANTIFQFKVDAAGLLAPNGRVDGFPIGAGPRHLAFHPTLNAAYTINETARTVSSLTYDAGTGKLSAPKTQSGVAPGTVLNSGSGAHVLASPTGRHVFASIRGHNSISAFAVSPADGSLTFAANETAGGLIKTPRDFDIDPTGKFLVVANQDSASVLVLQVGADGNMTLQGAPVAVAKSPAFVGILLLP